MDGLPTRDRLQGVTVRVPQPLTTWLLAMVPAGLRRGRDRQQACLRHPWTRVVCPARPTQVITADEGGVGQAQGPYM